MKIILLVLSILTSSTIFGIEFDKTTRDIHIQQIQENNQIAIAQYDQIGKFFLGFKTWGKVIHEKPSDSNQLACSSQISLELSYSYFKTYLTMTLKDKETGTVVNALSIEMDESDDMNSKYMKFSNNNISFETNVTFKKSANKIIINASKIYNDQFGDTIIIKCEFNAESWY